MTHYTHEQIAALLEGRTPGTWKATVSIERGEFEIWAHSPNDDWTGPMPVLLGGLDLLHRPEADAEFIAAAPDIVQQLLDEVEALQAEVDSWRDTYCQAVE